MVESSIRTSVERYINALMFKMNIEIGLGISKL